MGLDDADGDVLTWSLTGAPGGMTVDPATGAIRWDFALPGTYALELLVTDVHNPRSVAYQLQRILTDLDAKASTEASRRLAQAVQREITGAVRTRFGEDKDLGVKSALFYVLLGARMPAVLLEVGFISNEAEAARLRTPAHQERIAAAVAAPAPSRPPWAAT